MANASFSARLTASTPPVVFRATANNHPGSALIWSSSGECAAACEGPLADAFAV